MTDWIDSEISKLQVGWRYSGALASCPCSEYNPVFRQARASPATATRKNGVLTEWQIREFNDNIEFHKRENLGVHDVTIFIAVD